MKNSEFYEILLLLKGIEPEDACNSCGALGTKSYGSTATWRGGIGGQMVTSDVCDKCWGSGSSVNPWPSWRGRK